MMICTHQSSVEWYLICFRITAMASRMFTTLGKIGLGLAITGSVVNTALYNGKFVCMNTIVVTRMLCDSCACYMVL